MKLLYILAEMDDFWGSRLPLALAAQKNGCEILVAAPHAASDEKLKEYKFKGFDLPESKKGFAPAAVIQNIFAVKNLINTEQPDIVHTITLKYCFITGLAVHDIKAPRFIFTVAGLGYLFSGKIKANLMRVAVKPFLKLALSHSNATITFQNSDDMRQLIDGKYVTSDRAVLIRGSGIDLKKFLPANNVTSKPPLVLMATRLVHDKGISVFIEAAKILEKAQIPAVFQLAGGVTDHNPRAMKKEQLETMLKGSPVKWLGKVADMPALYAKADIIVFPSWYREGIPRVLLEAAAMGKPLVTTDHPGCREAVNNNENGFLIPIKNAKACAEAIEKLLRDENMRIEMGRKSRLLAEAEFDVEKITAQTIKVYGF